MPTYPRATDAAHGRCHIAQPAADLSARRDARLNRRMGDGKCHIAQPAADASARRDARRNRRMGDGKCHIAQPAADASARRDARRKGGSLGRAQRGKTGKFSP